MELSETLNSWCGKLHYRADLSAKKRICNASTVSIWMQIVENVKPRQEIEHARNNFVIHQLRKKRTKGSTGGLSLQAPEIRAYEKRQKLDDDVAQLSGFIEEKQKRVDCFAKQNAAIYVRMENVTQKIKENEEMTYLYEKKSAMIANEILDAEEKLSYCRSLTPIEEQTNDVSVVLNECSLKLEKLIAVKDFEFASVPDVSWQSPNLSRTPNLRSCKIAPGGGGGFVTPACKDIRKFVTFLSNNKTLLENRLDGEMVFVRDETLRAAVGRMLGAHNRKLVWNTLRAIETDARTDLKCANRAERRNEPKVAEQHRFEQLYARHVDVELETARLRFHVGSLKKRLAEKMDEFNETYAVLSVQEIKTSMLLRIDQTVLSAVVKVLNENINRLRSLVFDGNEMIEMQEKFKQLQRSYVNTVRGLLYKTRLFEHSQTVIASVARDTESLIGKLGKFTYNFNWMRHLGNGLANKEIQLFGRFRLDHNRRFNFTSKTKFYRDFNTMRMPFEPNLETNAVSMLVALVDTPFSFPESRMLGILSDRERLDKMKAIKRTTVESQQKNYSLKQLQKQESRVDHQTDRLLQLVHRRRGFSVSHMQEMMRLFWEMPFKDAIDATRSYDGHKYAHYESLYDEYYNQL